MKRIPPNKKSNKEFTEQVINLVGDEYVFLEEYIGARTKIKVKHNIDNCYNTYEVSPDNFLRGYRCPECYNKNRGNLRAKTHDEFCREVFNLVGDEYQVINKYISAQDKIILKHTVCNNMYPTRPNDFYQAVGVLFVINRKVKKELPIILLNIT